MPNKLIIKKGDVFGRLTVISEPIHYISPKGKQKGYKYICRCICGDEKEYFASNLNKNISRMCISCANNDKNIIEVKKGDVFGKLKVIDEITIYKGRPKRRHYKCKCECGSVGIYSLCNISRGKRKSCRVCSISSRPQSLNYDWLKKIYSIFIVRRIKTSKKTIENNLSIEEFFNIITKDCYYCGEKPSEKKYLNKRKLVSEVKIIMNGVDRVDSNKGYSVENCVPCCGACNKMKMVLSVDDFYSKIEKIYKLRVKNYAKKRNKTIS